VPVRCGAFWLAGPGGSKATPDGADGGAESSTYGLEPAEQRERPPATEAVARNVVVVSSATGAVRPVRAKSAAVPEATGVPVQSLVVYTLTVEPAMAVPL
jgi:hypothetical protein